MENQDRIIMEEERHRKKEIMEENHESIKFIFNTFQ
jgi:hypothetical protein